MTESYGLRPHPEHQKSHGNRVGKLVSSTSVELNPRATCDEAGCTWPAVDAAYAENAATVHAQDTGHSVTVDHIRRQVVTAS